MISRTVTSSRICPQSRSDRLGPDNKEGIRQTNHAVGMNMPQPGLAGAHHHQPTTDAGIILVQFVGCQRAVSQGNERGLGVRLVEQAMRRQVDDRTTSASCEQLGPRLPRAPRRGLTRSFSATSRASCSTPGRGSLEPDGRSLARQRFARGLASGTSHNPCEYLSPILC